MRPFFLDASMHYRAGFMMRTEIRRDHEAQAVAKKVARLHAKGKEMERISCFICRRMSASAITTGGKALF